MALNKINLYDTFVKFPSDDDIKKMGNKLCHLVYATPYASSIIEYAGRTCYRSFNNMQNESYKNFISAVVSRGHESVIEHSNLVYVVFKRYNKELKFDSDNINRYLITLMMYNGLIRVTENQGYYLISGNIRMFKDLIREYYRIKEISNKVNPILDNIKDSFYSLPMYYFGDMVKTGILEEKKFKLDSRFTESMSSMNFKPLSNYVSVINHDNFTFRVRGFSIMINGVSTIRRLVTPTNILKKHNRITLLITAPRYITHQLVRHRMASYSQASQRYILEEGNNVYMPPMIKEKNLESLADNCFKNCFNVYGALVDGGINKEDARSVLPNAFMSTIVMTITIDKLENFLSLRCDKAAQAFIRDEIAVPLKEYIDNYYRKSEEGDDTPPPYKTNAIGNKYAKQEENRKNTNGKGQKTDKKQFKNKKENKPLKKEGVANKTDKHQQQQKPRVKKDAVNVEKKQASLTPNNKPKVFSPKPKFNNTKRKPNTKLNSRKK